MTRVKLDTPAFADQSVDTRTIKDGTIIAQDVSGSLTNAKLTNSSFTINGTAVSLGGSGTFTPLVEWQAVTVADGSTTLTAEAGKGYFLDTNTGVIEVFLPSSPSRGDTIILVDYSGTFATNQAIINTGGQLIDSTTGPDFKLTTNNTIAELVYIDANKGWQVILNQAAGTTPDAILTPAGQYGAKIVATGGTITTDGDFKIHSFTGDGNFVVSAISPTAADNEVSYVVVAGGGGGGSGGLRSAGGGGAGGYRESKSGVDNYTASPVAGSADITITATTFPITVGAGGAGATSDGKGSNGNNSVFSTITSTAGGAGGGQGSGPGNNGGSGGGGGDRGNGSDPGGNGNTPPVSPSQGNNGGTSSAHPNSAGGGGGGIGAVGANGHPTGGNGGAGVASEITGSSVTRAGGGGGGHPSNPGCGGAGGGGNGAGPSPTPGTTGTANTGGGGGGGNQNNGTAGGKGIVIIRYKFQ